MKNKNRSKSEKQHNTLQENLQYLKLPFINEHHQNLAEMAATKQWTHLDFLEKLIKGETDLRCDRATQRRIRQARFPVIKTISFDFGRIRLSTY